MKSAFDVSWQNTNTDSKIVVALERIATAFRVLLWKESIENSLSPVQIQILLFLRFHSDDKCKVGYLAQEFNMTKATVSDSVKVLEQKLLVYKYEDSNDARSQIIGLTKEGKKMAEKSSGFSSSIEKPLSKLPGEQKQIILDGLIQLIYELYQEGLITKQRMCFSCIHYAVHIDSSFCKLMQVALDPDQIRIDCPEHESVN